MKRGDAEAISIVQRAPFIAMSSTVLGKLLGGFAVGSKEAKNRQELEIFLASPRVRLHGVDRETAEKYAVVFAAFTFNEPSILCKELIPSVPFIAVTSV